jgi:hypothetical protein
LTENDHYRGTFAPFGDFPMILGEIALTKPGLIPALRQPEPGS